MLIRNDMDSENRGLETSSIMLRISVLLFNLLGYKTNKFINSFPQSGDEVYVSNEGFDKSISSIKFGYLVAYLNVIM